MELDFSLKENIFLWFLNILWNILTYGYVSLILSIIIMVVGIFFLFIVILNYQIIIYILKDKFSYLKFYLYINIVEKINYVKYWVFTIIYKTNNSNLKNIILSIILFILIIAFLIFMLKYVNHLAELKYINETIENTGVLNLNISNQ